MQFVAVLTNQLVQLVIHEATDSSPVLFDLGDITYHIVGIAIGDVVAIV